MKMPLLEELSQTCQDNPILSNRIPIRTNPGTIGSTRQKMAFFVFSTSRRIKPIVPGIVRIGFRFERIQGRSV